MTRRFAQIDVFSATETGGNPVAVVLDATDIQAVINSDYPALQGFVLVAAGFILIVYLVVDILYELADPRIKV